MLADYHVHTEFSDDSTYPMEEVVCDSIKMGLDEICFTDHVDYGVKVDWDSGESILYRGSEPFANVEYPRYVAEFYRLKKKYEGKISLRLGLEFGMQRHTTGKYEELFARYPFDFIILSVHQVDDREFWTGDFQQGKTREEYIFGYYQEVLSLVRRYHHYSVLGHLDLISRYDLDYERLGPYPFPEIKPIITQILKTAIDDGKGIEFNTSFHRYGLNDTTPSVDILKLYRDLGGEILTVGSDSHKREHLGGYLDEAYKILKDLGFKYFCTYEAMKPVFHKL